MLYTKPPHPTKKGLFPVPIRRSLYGAVCCMKKLLMSFFRTLILPSVYGSVSCPPASERCTRAEGHRLIKEMEETTSTSTQYITNYAIKACDMLASCRGTDRRANGHIFRRSRKCQRTFPPNPTDRETGRHYYPTYRKAFLWRKMMTHFSSVASFSPPVRRWLLCGSRFIAHGFLALAALRNPVRGCVVRLVLARSLKATSVPYTGRRRVAT